MVPVVEAGEIGLDPFEPGDFYVRPSVFGAFVLVAVHTGEVIFGHLVDDTLDIGILVAADTGDTHTAAGEGDHWKTELVAVDAHGGAEAGVGAARLHLALQHIGAKGKIEEVGHQSVSFGWGSAILDMLS